MNNTNIDFKSAGRPVSKGKQCAGLYDDETTINVEMLSKTANERKGQRRKRESSFPLVATTTGRRNLF